MEKGPMGTLSDIQAAVIVDKKTLIIIIIINLAHKLLNKITEDTEEYRTSMKLNIRKT